MLGPLTWIALVFLCIVMLKIKDLLYRGFFLIEKLVIEWPWINQDLFLLLSTTFSDGVY
jgi:hypothetical protein